MQISHTEFHPNPKIKAEVTDRNSFTSHSFQCVENSLKSRLLYGIVYRFCVRNFTKISKRIWEGQIEKHLRLKKNVILTAAILKTITLAWHRCENESCTRSDVSLTNVFCRRSPCSFYFISQNLNCEELSGISVFYRRVKKIFVRLETYAA